MRASDREEISEEGFDSGRACTAKDVEVYWICPAMCDNASASIRLLMLRFVFERPASGVLRRTTSFRDGPPPFLCPVALFFDLVQHLAFQRGFDRLSWLIYGKNQMRWHVITGCPPSAGV